MNLSVRQVLAWLPLIGALSGLLGVILGAYLTRSWQRKQWLLDSKKAEYRELLSVLSQAAHYILNNSPHLEQPNPFGSLKSGEQERLSDEAVDRGHAIIADRIFIADTIAREKIDQRWVMVLTEKRVDKFWSAWEDLHRLLLKVSREDLKLKSL
jgi:hypothetical protein